MPKGCGKWDCPYCGPRKKKKLLDRVATYFAGHPGECRHLTLTLSDKYDDEQITKAWNRLKASLRKYNIILSYVWIKEFTIKGRRHMHLLIDQFIPKTLLSRLWYLATNETSFVVQINRRPIYNAAGYISKYVTKDVQNETRFKHKERRYGFSRTMCLPKKVKTGEWAFEMDYGLYEKSQKRGLTDLRLAWNDAHKKTEQKGCEPDGL